MKNFELSVEVEALNKNKNDIIVDGSFSSVYDVECR